MRGAFPALCALGLLVVMGCRAPNGSVGGKAPAPRLLAEARSQLSTGDADGALATLQGHADPEALTLQGKAWALKARKVPRAEVVDPIPEGAIPISLGPEEGRALRLLEAAAAAQPDLAEAHLALAELLEPGAFRWLTVQRDAAVSGERRRPVARPSAATAEPPLGPSRVLQEYRKAAQADRASVPIVESWLAFASAAQRPDEAEVALQELVVRRPRDPDPLVRYGDFLREVRGDTSGALDRYREALIWRAGDEGIRTRIVRVFLDMADQHLAHQEYGAVEQRLRDINRYAPFADPEVSRRFVALNQKLATIRGR